MGIAVGAMASWGTWYQGVIAREHNELSVKPSIRLIAYLEGESGRNGLYVANVGLGPAEVVGLQVAMAGKSYDLLKPGSQRQVLKDAGANLLCLAESQPEPGFFVRPGDLEPLFVSTRARLFTQCHLLVALMLMRQPMDFRVQYRSLYGHAFTHRQTVKVDSAALFGRLPVPESQ